MLNVRDWDATMSKPKNNHRVINNRNVLHIIIQSYKLAKVGVGLCLLVVKL